MSLGVHFALDSADVTTLVAAPDDDSRIKLLEEIEERYFSTPEYVAETDKAWDALHRSLADGQLSYDSGLYPLSYVVLGGEQLVRDRETGYTMSLKTPPEVVQCASALDELTVDEFSTRYYSIPPDEYGEPLSDEGLTYTWDALDAVRELFRVAASEGRYALPPPREQGLICLEWDQAEA
ncbi:hypothetical protein BH20ACT13_BH20ACT13_16330 [soil metagenome]